MNFEDIVDMDWLNSHTVDSLPSPAQEEPSVFPCGHYDIDYPMYDSFYNPSSTTQVVDPPLIATEEPTAATPPSPQDQKNEIVIPSTEQIKLLIELAKKQLALREQQAKAGGLTPEPDTPPIKLEEMPTVKLEELSSTTNTLSAAEVAASTSAAVAAPLSLFPPTVSIPDTISPESLIKTEKQMRRDSAISEDGPMSLEAYAESDGIDIKKLTSKERRQLRNKISARNFRVRRKEYISTLEGQVDDHKKSNQLLMERLNTVEEENKQLKQQLDNLKRQNQILQQNALPNLNKDIGVMGSKPAETYRQDNSILVS